MSTATKAQLAYRAQRFHLPSEEEKLRLLLKEGFDAIERQRGENIRIAALVGLSWCEECADWTPKVHEHYRPPLRDAEAEEAHADRMWKFRDWDNGREDE